MAQIVVLQMLLAVVVKIGALINMDAHHEWMRNNTCPATERPKNASIQQIFRELFFFCPTSKPFAQSGDTELASIIKDVLTFFYVSC